MLHSVCSSYLKKKKSDLNQIILTLCTGHSPNSAVFWTCG